MPELISGSRRWRWWRILAVIGIVILAAVLRVPAMRDLPYDIDERVYYPLAQRYARAVETADWVTLQHPFDNPEHPALVKLLFAAALVAQPGPTPQDAPGFAEGTGAQPRGLNTVRLVSLVATLLTVALLSWYTPLAGLVFALSSWQIKYGVVAYLEAVPGLLAGAALLLLARWWASYPTQIGQAGAEAAGAEPTITSHRLPIRLIAVGGLLGAAAAAKYPYAMIAAPTVGLCLLWRWRYPWAGWRGLTLVIGVSLLAFYVCNPFMWRNPVSYLAETVAFHLRYSGNELVQRQQFAPWDNLVLLFKPMPYDPFFPFSVFNQLRLEPILMTLGLLGLPLLWWRSPPLGIWLGLSLLFLLVWPTKWPHYTLMVIPALSLSAGNLLAAGIKTLGHTTIRLVRQRAP